MFMCLPGSLFSAMPLEMFRSTPNATIHRVPGGVITCADDLFVQIEKAKISQCHQIWITLNDWLRYRNNINFENLNIKWILEVPWDQSNELELKKNLTNCAIVFSISSAEQATTDDFKEFQARSHLNFSILYRPSFFENIKKTAFKLKLISNCFPLHFEFLPVSKSHSERWTVAQIRALLEQIKKFGFSCQPYPGLEFCEDRASNYKELETQPIARQYIQNKTPTLSVVIPFLNNSTFLKMVIECILGQTLSKESFELIIVNDGAIESLELLVHSLIERAPDLSLTYVIYPRERLGVVDAEFLYRAGASRNVGAQYARGDFLLFLDSDILTPPDLFKNILNELLFFDVVQCPRRHISEDQSQLDIKICDLNNKNTYVNNHRYWNVFFQTKSWQNIKFKYRYTATYCLALKREDFYTAGRFKRPFTTYGFEDVELGFTLDRMGKTFSLLKENVFHLTPHRSRAQQYASGEANRFKALCKSAQTFFLLHLDPEVFDLLKYYMVRERLTFGYLKIYDKILKFLY